MGNFQFLCIRIAINDQILEFFVQNVSKWSLLCETTSCLALACRNGRGRCNHAAAGPALAASRTGPAAPHRLPQLAAPRRMQPAAAAAVSGRRSAACGGSVRCSSPHCCAMQKVRGHLLFGLIFGTVQLIYVSPHRVQQRASCGLCVDWKI